ncbi:MAG: hypothetical protein DRP85_00975 [Candidatus Makaraimicrobium thalassicum]|nr:MAG: hypothetical protein DRP85_00975 [Candidatus Omnitrophota bacterium]
MRLDKFIVTGIIVTVAATGYVHQRVEIVKAAYGLQETGRHLSCLVDQNSKLMYNLSRLESPGYLLASLNGEEIEFANYGTRRVDSCQLALGDSGNGSASESFIDKFLDLFTLSAEAKPRE